MASAQRFSGPWAGMSQVSQMPPPVKFCRRQTNSHRSMGEVSSDRELMEMQIRKEYRRAYNAHIGCELSLEASVRGNPHSSISFEEMFATLSAPSSPRRHNNLNGG
mmetsp:Transcript_31330/g.84001  ORF Transcript_31330/g.84001 Transcript_31330/m.84001 type:complete len:106 (+) Transcript_31330:22-339(+)